MQDPASFPRQDALNNQNVRVSDGDPSRNQPHPNEDDKPPGRWFLRSSSHLAILPSNTLRHYGRYIRSSSLGPSFCPYSPECVEGVFSEVGLPLYGVLRSSAIVQHRGSGKGLSRAPPFCGSRLGVYF